MDTIIGIGISKTKKKNLTRGRKKKFLVLLENIKKKHMKFQITKNKIKTTLEDNMNFKSNDN